MTKITLAAALEILKGCSAVVVDDDVLVYPSCSDLDDTCPFLTLSDEGTEMLHVFSPEKNAEPEIVGSSLFLVDDDGVIVQLTILEPRDLEA